MGDSEWMLTMFLVLSAILVIGALFVGARNKKGAQDEAEKSDSD